MSRILLVDDDPHISRVMNIWLTRHGYTLATAGNGAEGLDIVCAGGVDLIVSDLNMPVMDGGDMVRAIRQRGYTDLPIILLTARCERDSIIKQLEPLGVSVYPKPFSPSRLVAEVQARLAESACVTEPAEVRVSPEDESVSFGTHTGGGA